MQEYTIVSERNAEGKVDYYRKYGDALNPIVKPTHEEQIIISKHKGIMINRKIKRLETKVCEI